MLMKCSNLLFIISLITYISLTACHKNNNTNDCPPNCPQDTIKEEGLKIVWKEHFDQTPDVVDSFFYSSNLCLYEGDLIHTKYYSRDFGVKSRIIRRDGNTGKIKWEAKMDFHDTSEIDVYKDKLIVQSGNNTVCLDINNGDKLWKYSTLPEHCGTGSLSIIDGYAYVIKADCMFPRQAYEKLIRLDIDTGEPEEVLTFNRNYNNKTSPFVGVPAKMTNDKGEDILYFGITWIGQSSVDTADYYAYNLTKKEMLWEKKKHDRTDGSYPPLIDNGKVYFYGGYTVHCFDAETGEQIWKTQVPNQKLNCLAGNRPIIVGDQLIVKPYSRKMLSIDKNRGRIQWYHERTEMSAIKYFVPYKDKLYFSCNAPGVIGSINLSNGKTVMYEYSPFERTEGGKFNYDGIAINTEKGYLYAQDGVYVMCIDISGE